MKCPKCGFEYDKQNHRMMETSTLCSSCYREGIKELAQLEAENKSLRQQLATAKEALEQLLNKDVIALSEVGRIARQALEKLENA